jgi:hypothetical protein
MPVWQVLVQVDSQCSVVTWPHDHAREDYLSLAASPGRWALEVVEVVVAVYSKHLCFVHSLSLAAPGLFPPVKVEVPQYVL